MIVFEGSRFTTEKDKKAIVSPKEMVMQLDLKRYFGGR
jgi:hypothetical protein